MPSFTGNKFSNFYKRILQINQSSNTGADANTRNIIDGDGGSTVASISDDQLLVKPVNDDTTTTLAVQDSGGNNRLTVDTTNSNVNGPSNHNVLTQYAYFGVNYVDFSSLSANTHYPIPFGASTGGATGTNDVDFGTGTAPDLIFTTGNTDTQYASQIVPCMWYVPDSISIDSVTSIEGADNATGDTTRMHLMSFTFNNASTSCLTAGTLLAHNSDVTNAGNEQAYKSTWTVDSASVAADKVIVAFFRSDSINSDYSLNVTVKYHIK